MKYTLFILIAVIAVLLTYFLFAVSRNGDEAQSPVMQEQTTQGNLETRTDEQGQVAVKVTPRILSDDQWKFDVVFDTHSVELDKDLMQIAELADGQGNVYKPILWEGAGPGGHHREGILVFQYINPTPSSIELKIKNIGGVPERSFKWNLQ